MTIKHASNHANGLLPIVITASAVTAIVQIWLAAVSRQVTEPYLDEIFHVGQAQTYCAGKFQEWDPKITTPPGLYLLSYLAYRIFGVCDLHSLRALNSLLFPCLFALIAMVGTPRRIHIAFNVCLFPPLFFFGGLYYTDVASTLFVLVFYYHFFTIHSTGDPTLLDCIISVGLAVWSLFFRQTNIFWVGVFPLGILLLNTLGERKIVSKDKKSRLDFLGDLRLAVQRSWSENVIYDARLRGGDMEDYVLSIFSILTGALKILTVPTRLLRALRLLLPYITVLTLFGLFVIYNGGVVLGDKSNHVATLHLAQLLYLWPYITFFSLPLAYPYFLQGTVALLATVFTGFEPLLMFSRNKLLPRTLVALAISGLGALIVRYNTIVHPFTLADNRHYTFYVFRLLMKHPMIKYLAVPVYMVCAWTSIETLGAPAQFMTPPKNKIRASSGTQAPSKDPGNAAPARNSNASPPFKLTVQVNDATNGEGCTVSFLLVWLATSALQLVTAPLVEPRYFILPWIMWRLRVPFAAPKPSSTVKDDRGGIAKWSRALWHEYDTRLWFETIWFLVVNAVTGYIFLNWGYGWPQEPGKVQRFMW